MVGRLSVSYYSEMPRYLIGIGCFLILTTSMGRDWEIHPGDEIQPVLDRAQPGDQVTIYSGHYPGSLVVDKSLSITGLDYPVIDGEKSGNTVRILADDVILSGLEIVWSGTRLLEDEAGIKVEGDRMIVRECRILNTLHGIYVKGGNEAWIENNFVRGRADLIAALRGNGIHLWNSKGNRIYNNEITLTRDGIYFSFADETHIRGNHIHHVRYGLHYMYSDDNNFEDNLFAYNVAGAALMYSKRIHFSRNTFAHNRGYRAYGVLYQSCDFCTATENLISDNTRGIYLDGSNFNEIWQNSIRNNDIAVHINASCEENKFFKNNFIDNLSGLVVDARGYPNHWSDEGHGNYWANYTGYDLNGDGIGDVPHKIQSVFEYLEEDYPEVRLYLFSPAAQILRAAERTLPIMQASEKEDPFPLMNAVENPDVPEEGTPESDGRWTMPWLLVFGLISLVPAGVITVNWL